MTAASIANSSQNRRDTSVSVTVPSIADSPSDITIVMESANATVTGVSLGDTVSAAPQTALPTDCHFLGAYVSAADTITFEFRATKNQPVTGAAVTFNLAIIDKTS